MPRPTFFLIDGHITDDTRDIVRRITDDGHAIGLHSGSRRLMIESANYLAALLDRNAGRIRDITGREPCRLFRPHAGWRSGEMYIGLAKAGYQLAGWSWGMWDWDWWRDPKAARTATRLLRRAKSGDIAVIHDDQLTVGMRLPHETAQRLPHKTRPVPRGEEARHESLLPGFRHVREHYTTGSARNVDDQVGSCERLLPRS